MDISHNHVQRLLNNLGQFFLQPPVSVSNKAAVAEADYLFPDLPPPPDVELPAALRPTVGGGSSVTGGDSNNSRSSSLDDLHQWVSSAADMTAAALGRNPAGGGRGGIGGMGRPMLDNSNGFNTLPAAGGPASNAAMFR